MSPRLRSSLLLTLVPLALAARGSAAPTDLIVADTTIGGMVPFPWPAGPQGPPLSPFTTAPSSFVYAPDGYLYVADPVSDSVVRYYADGADDQVQGDPELDCALLCSLPPGFGVAGLVYDPADGTLLASGSGARQIVRIDPTFPPSCTVVHTFTGTGVNTEVPGALALHPLSGDLLIADTARDLVWILSITNGLGQFIPAGGTNPLSDPQDMVWRPAPAPNFYRLYVVSKGDNTVKRYTTGGSYIDDAAPRGGESPAISAPDGLAFSPGGGMYVGDAAGGGRILQYTAPASGFPGTFVGTFATGVTPTHLAFRSPSRAVFPLAAGEIVCTYYPDGGAADGFTVKIVDPRGDGPRGRNWVAPMYSHEDAAAEQIWNMANTGPVFGLCLDGDANIYVAATSAYGSHPLIDYPAGPGAVYRIDKSTGNISVWLGTTPGAVSSVPSASSVGLSTLPNTGPGLGNISYDPYRDQFYVANLEDGKIYRVRDVAGIGVIQQAFDPFGNDDIIDGTPGFPALGERVYAVHAVNNRVVLWSTWLRDQARPTTPWPSTGPSAWPPLPSGELPNNAVFKSESVGMGGVLSGTFLWKVMPCLNPGAGLTYSNPVTDITDDDLVTGYPPPGGSILLAERTFAGDYGMINSGPSAHRSRVLEYQQSSTGFPPSPSIFHAGRFIASGLQQHSNSAGGVSYDVDSNVWVTSDALGTNAEIGSPPTCGDYPYGVERIPSSGNGGDSPVTVNCILIDLDRYTETYDKSQPGDVDLVVFPGPRPKWHITCAGDSWANCPCGSSGGLNRGCANSSFPTGALLWVDGTASVGNDTLTLHCDDMPSNTFSLYFQGVNVPNAPLGLAFGDGLRCAGGGLVRLRTVFTGPAGVSQYPGGGDSPVSIRGMAAAGETRSYQVWYRDVNPGNCTNSGFNLSNGVTFTWEP